MVQIMFLSSRSEFSPRTDHSKFVMDKPVLILDPVFVWERE